MPIHTYTQVQCTVYTSISLYCAIVKEYDYLIGGKDSGGIKTGYLTAV